MKYLLAFFVFGIIFIILSPVFLIKWDLKGMKTILEGIGEVFGLD
jgi:hypothetical protein